MPDHLLRASEAERDQTIVSLSDHFAVGRLTRDELDQRVDQALQAKTQVQLEALLLDLQAQPMAPNSTIRSDTTSATGASRPTIWLRWATTAIICLLVWSVTSIAAGTASYFWPAWVIGPWGIVLAARSLHHGRDVS